MTTNRFRSFVKQMLPADKRLRRIRFGPAVGCWMELDLRSQARILFGVYERELLPYYRSLLKPGMRSFDIGGRDGYSALLVASITKAPVLSFECEAESIAEMKRVFGANNLPIEVVGAFVGSWIDNERTTIDAMAATHFAPDFIKMDIEGGEVEALRGADHVLSVHRPALIIEVHGRDREHFCIQHIQQYRYDLKAVDQARFFREQRPLEHNRWLICVPKTSDSRII